MSYTGIQGMYTSRPKYLHRDDSIDETPERPMIGYHDTCAVITFKVDTSVEGWGRWHHDSGLVWGPWLAGVKCEACGKDC